MPLQSAVSVRRMLFDGKIASEGLRSVPEETPVALSYDRATYAVMMASPSDLEDFAVGFSLTEKIIESPRDISDLEIVALPNGVEVRMSLSAAPGSAFDERRRRFAGVAGCGLCGMESLDAATAAAPRIVSDLRVPAVAIFEAVGTIRAAQALNAQTRAAHAAGFWSPEEHAYLSVREDVGRHNALDKLIGALARMRSGHAEGILVLTSRVSIELVQKAAIGGLPILVAVSAPTAFALRAAEAAGMTIVGIARDDSFEVFTHSERIVS